MTTTAAWHCFYFVQHNCQHGGIHAVPQKNGWEKKWCRRLMMLLAPLVSVCCFISEVEHLTRDSFTTDNKDGTFPRSQKVHRPRLEGFRWIMDLLSHVEGVVHHYIYSVWRYSGMWQRRHKCIIRLKVGPYRRVTFSTDGLVIVALLLC